MLKTIHRLLARLLSVIHKTTVCTRKTRKHSEIMQYSTVRGRQVAVYRNILFIKT